MNKTMLLALGAALLMGGCAQDEPEPSSGEPAAAVICFDAPQADNLRGVPSEEEAPTRPTTTFNIRNFKITAYSPNEWGQDTLVMDNTEVFRTGNNSWTYAPEEHWPDKPVDFYAVSPVEISMNNNRWWIHLVDFNWDTWQGDMDFLVAVRKNVTQTSGRLKLNFRHALARILVGIKTDLDPKKYEVRVAEVTLNGFAKSARFIFPEFTTTMDQNVGDLFPFWTSWNTTATVTALFSQPQEQGYLTVSAEPWATMPQGKYFIPIELERMHTQNLDYYEGTRLEVAYKVVDLQSGATVWPTAHTYRGDLWRQDKSYGIGRISLRDATPGHRWLPGHAYAYTVSLRLPAP